MNRGIGGKLNSGPVDSCPNASVIMLKIKFTQALSQNVSLGHMQMLHCEFIGNILEIDAALLANDGFELRKLRFEADQTERVTNVDDRIIFLNNNCSIHHQSPKTHPALPH